MDKHDEQPKQEKKRSVTPAIVFFILLAALTVVAFILPLRPTRSYSEKRELTPFPEFSAAALLCDCLILPYQHIGVYGMILFSAALSFVLVWLTTKFEYGLLLSDALGVLSGYIPAYLLIKYAGQYFITPENNYLYMTEISHYPLMIGCVAGGVIAFLAVPAVRVLERYAKEKKEQN